MIEPHMYTCTLIYVISLTTINLKISFALYLAENQLKTLKRYEFGKVFFKGKDTSPFKEMYQIVSINLF